MYRYDEFDQEFVAGRVAAGLLSAAVFGVALDERTSGEWASLVVGPA